MFFRFTLLTGTIALTLSAAQSLHAQTTSDLWRDISERQLIGAKMTTAAAGNRTVRPDRYRTLQLDRAGIERMLRAVPAEFSVPMDSSPELEIPMPQGGFARFHLQESPIMEPELAAKFPEIKTYIGQGIDDPTAVMRADLTPRGFHAIIFSDEGVIYIDPYWRDDDASYLSYFKRDFVSDKRMECLVGSRTELAKKEEQAGGPRLSRPTGPVLKRYRLALACTGEYAVRVSSPNAATVPRVLAAMVTSVNRVSGIYEREVGVRFLLIANTDQLIYLNGGTDPYTNDDGFAMLNQNQANITAVIGSANFDFGHVFSTGGGGVAGIEVVCSSAKAEGVTGSPDPVGDPFDVDYVAHEMGHQFGGNHTFNSTVKSCGGGNRNSSTAYETGSGTTIMAYAGICGGTNLAANSDGYFHTGSYTEIDNFINGDGASCAFTIATGNTPPVIAPLSAYTIPVNTPFALTGSASDAEGDTLTYCWEQFNTSASGQSTTAPSSTSTGAIFRSFPPTTDRTRVFPSLTYILNNANTPPAAVGDFATGEILPSITRTMTFRLTARDNRAGAGGSDWASATVTTNVAAGPFTVTAFNSAANVAAGSAQTVTWNVANSNLAPVNCANVRISLSIDGGHTFPYLLANTVANNGSANVTIPNVSGIATTQGRIKVEAVANIFFDISGANLTITFTDTDGDGIPDGFESANGLNPNDPADGAQDLDGDGASNFNEFIAGTNLNDRTSKLQITNMARAASSVAVTFTTVANKRYQIEASPDLATWTAISGDILPSSATASYDDPQGGKAASPQLDHRFYRARVFP